MKSKLLILFLSLACFACKKESLEDQWKECCQSNNISLVNDSTYIMLPTVFSPNGDSVNDVLRIFHSRALQGNNPTHIKIRNIDNALVFESNDIQVGWDGSHNNGQAPEGRYTFEVTWETSSLQQLTLSGTICLLRDCLPPNTVLNNCLFASQFDASLPGFDPALSNGEPSYPVCN